ncbi:MAG: helix-turn-helix domain-containing protein [Nannocystaceae bacterium]|nr:helix-turn-helix domain-containing protein [bacterium]
MSETSRRLQENVVQARKQRRWSQRRLADEAGVAVETVQKLEAGRPSVTLSVLERVAEALEVPVAVLLGEGGEAGPFVGWRSLGAAERTFVRALVGYFAARAGGR